MRDALKAYLALAGGLAEVPRQRALATAKALVAQGEATAEQVGSLAEDLVSQSKANREAVTALVKYEVDRNLGRVGLASAEEVGGLAARVQALEAELRALRAATPGRSAASATGSVGAGGLAAAAPAAKVAATRPPAKKAPAKKAPATRAPAKKAVAGKSPATNGPAKNGPATTSSLTTSPDQTSPDQTSPDQMGPSAAPVVKTVPAADPASTQAPAKTGATGDTTGSS